MSTVDSEFDEENKGNRIDGNETEFFISNGTLEDIHDDDATSMWGKVRNVLTGRTDLYAYDPTRHYDQESCDSAVQLMILIWIQKRIKSFISYFNWFSLFLRDYDKDYTMKKYIYIEFNVSSFFFQNILYSSSYLSAYFDA